MTLKKPSSMNSLTLHMQHTDHNLQQQQQLNVDGPTYRSRSRVAAVQGLRELAQKWPGVQH
jgi:hypothetical protein